MSEPVLLARRGEAGTRGLREKMMRRCPTPRGEQWCRYTGHGVRGQPYVGEAVLRTYARSPTAPHRPS